MARLTVTGYGEVSVPPDEARVDLNVVARGDSPGEALSGVADRAKSLVALLDELGIPPEQRLTSGIWAHDDREPGGATRFQAGERLTVTVSADLVGTLLDAASSRAEAQVHGPQFVVAQENPARGEALKVAAENARGRAEALASGLGLRLGAVVEGGEGGGFHPVTRTLDFATVEAGPPVEASQATVAASVTVTFEAEPA